MPFPLSWSAKTLNLSMFLLKKYRYCLSISSFWNGHRLLPRSYGACINGCIHGNGEAKCDSQTWRTCWTFVQRKALSAARNQRMAMMLQHSYLPLPVERIKLIWMSQNCLEAIVLRLEATVRSPPSAIASRLEAIALRVEAIASVRCFKTMLMRRWQKLKYQHQRGEETWDWLNHNVFIGVSNTFNTEWHFNCQLHGGGGSTKRATPYNLQRKGVAADELWKRTE